MENKGVKKVAFAAANESDPLSQRDGGVEAANALGLVVVSDSVAYQIDTTDFTPVLLPVIQTQPKGRVDRAERGRDCRAYWRQRGGQVLDPSGVTGLREIHSGEIHYMGDRLDGISAAQIVKRGIAMVPEGRRVFP